MKWRMGLAILLGILLVLPLAWLLQQSTMHGLRPKKHDFQPVARLPIEALNQLLTFRRSCQSDADCDAQLICLKQFMHDAICVPSVCDTDLDCREGFACRFIQQGRRVVRICGAVGRAKADEPCLKLPTDQEEGCAPGLVCAEYQCRRRCQSEDPPCPAGFACHEGDPEGPVCMPSCETQTCPEGQHCVRMQNGSSGCARVQGRDCQQGEACTDSQVCVAHLGRKDHVGEAWMQCLRPCEDQRDESCPPDFECFGKRCLKRCSTATPEACEPFESCWMGSSGASGVCTFKN